MPNDTETAAALVERGFDLQFRRVDRDADWTSIFGARPVSEALARETLIRDAAMDYDARPDDSGDVEWRIARVLEEVIEPPRTSQQVVEWLAAKP